MTHFCIYSLTCMTTTMDPTAAVDLMNPRGWDRLQGLVTLAPAFRLRRLVTPQLMKFQALVCTEAQLACAFIYRTALIRIRKLFPDGTSDSLLEGQRSPCITTPTSIKCECRLRCCHRLDILPTKSAHDVSDCPRGTWTPTSWA